MAGPWQLAKRFPEPAESTGFAVHRAGRTPYMSQTPLRALALVCSLKSSPARSSSELIAEHVFATLRDEGVACAAVRCVDFAIAPGVEPDMGDGDQWPQIRRQVIDSDILLVSTPVWLGYPSSVTQRVLERLDAELSNSDEEGRPALAGKVAIVSVVGNEDGAHKTVADVFQALNDVGYSIPAQGCIGTARRCKQPTTTISTRFPRRWHRPRPRQRATPHTWLGPSNLKAIHRTNDVGK